MLLSAGDFTAHPSKAQAQMYQCGKVNYLRDNTTKGVLTTTTTVSQEAHVHLGKSITIRELIHGSGVNLPTLHMNRLRCIATETYKCIYNMSPVYLRDSVEVKQTGNMK